MRTWTIIAIVCGVAIVLLAGMWLWVLASADPLQNPLSRLPWPVACTTRGCITTTQWQHQATLEGSFAQAAAAIAPDSRQTLTTLVRQHLVDHSVIRAPATLADATRYRTEILNLKDDAAISRITALSATEYDEQVVLPYLLQEAARQQRKVESVDELYAQLASDRIVVVLPFHLKWDKNAGKVGE